MSGSDEEANGNACKKREASMQRGSGSARHACRAQQTQSTHRTAENHARKATKQRTQKLRPLRAPLGEGDAARLVHAVGVGADDDGELSAEGKQCDG
jgi:hypothetical protein